MPDNMTRDQFAEAFVKEGKSRGKSKEEIAQKLDLALQQYDKDYGNQAPEPQSGADVRNGFDTFADVGKAASTGVFGYLGEKAGVAPGAFLGAAGANFLGSAMQEQVDRFQDPSRSGGEKALDAVEWLYGMALNPSSIPGKLGRDLGENTEKSKDALKDAGMAGATAALFSLVFNPNGNLNAARDYFVKKNGARVVDGNKVVEQLTKEYNKIPAAQKTKSVKAAYEATVKELKDKTIPLKRALEMKRRYYAPSFSPTTGNPLKGTATDRVLKAAGQGMRNLTRPLSRGASVVDDIQSGVMGIKQGVRWPVKTAIGTGIGYGAVQALQRMLGR